ncbi:hypothetical protein SAMN04489724_0872 [Algoriphagus locisalis]|uniref:Uncharacterized protein n=1 Tax=Algoriphagus locisalis TaxID=305507 RepID=A0A1I6Y8J3_9BACT|nr:hypothetical protein SAMN04489724_0872 [Algoriphagus locisalis]
MLSRVSGVGRPILRLRSVQVPDVDVKTGDRRRECAPSRYGEAVAVISLSVRSASLLRLLPRALPFSQ